MAILTRQFFYHEKDNHDETWYHLARDTETGAVFIEHEWAARGDVGSKRIEIAEFLGGPKMSARDKLLKLIGTLVPESSEAVAASFLRNLSSLHMTVGDREAGHTSP